MTYTPILYGAKRISDNTQATVIMTNKCAIPTDILVPIVKAAAEHVDCSKSIVGITFTSGETMRGVAYGGQRCRVVVPFSKASGMSWRYKRDTSTKIALSIYHIIVHELYHNADKQKGTFISWSNNSRHDDRPCEIAAEAAANAAIDAVQHGFLDTLINWLEEFRHASVPKTKMKKVNVNTYLEQILFTPVKPPVRTPPSIPKYERVASNK